MIVIGSVRRFAAFSDHDHGVGAQRIGSAVGVAVVTAVFFSTVA
jgi:hypothetical protein